MPYKPIIPKLIIKNHSRGIITPIKDNKYLTPNKAKNITANFDKNFAIFSIIKITTSIYEVMIIKMIFYFQKI